MPEPTVLWYRILSFEAPVRYGPGPSRKPDSALRVL